MRESADERITRMMECHGDALLRLCAMQLRDADLARDAVQDSFWKAYQRLDTFRDECSEKTWLTRIAINTCRDYRRRAWFRQRRESVDVDALALPGGTEADARDDTVFRAVLSLPAREREAVLLRYYQRLQLSEIAQALGIPEGTVNSRLNRARSRLRAHLEGWYLDEDV